MASTGCGLPRGRAAHEQEGPLGSTMPTNHSQRNVIAAAAHTRSAPNHEDRLPKIDEGSVGVQWVRCGKPTCRCARGERHGPYSYRFWREDGRLRKRYIPAADVAAVRRACERRRLREERARTERRAGTAVWRALSAELKEMLPDG